MYPTRFDNKDISAISDELQLSLKKQSTLAIKLNKYKKDELLSKLQQSRMNNDIPGSNYEMKFENQQLYGEAIHIKGKKDSLERAKEDGSESYFNPSSPLQDPSHRRLTERRLSRISDNFHDDDLLDNTPEEDEAGRRAAENTTIGKAANDAVQK